MNLPSHISPRPLKQMLHAFLIWVVEHVLGGVRAVAAEETATIQLDVLDAQEKVLEKTVELARKTRQLRESDDELERELATNYAQTLRETSLLGKAILGQANPEERKELLARPLPDSLSGTTEQPLELTNGQARSTNDETTQELPIRKGPGRPVGSKDTKPRQARKRPTTGPPGAPSREREPGTPPILSPEKLAELEEALSQERRKGMGRKPRPQQDDEDELVDSKGTSEKEPRFRRRRKPEAKSTTKRAVVAAGLLLFVTTAWLAFGRGTGERPAPLPRPQELEVIPTQSFLDWVSIETERQEFRRDAMPTRWRLKSNTEETSPQTENEGLFGRSTREAAEAIRSLFKRIARIFI